MAETDQQTLTDDDPFGFSMAVDDLLELANALEPTDTIVTLQVDHDQVTASARDVANVLAVDVEQPANAPHARQITVDTGNLTDAVSELKWAEDHTYLQVQPERDHLWVFDGDDHRRAFAEVPLENPTNAYETPDFDGMLEETSFEAIADCEAWQLAGALWTATAPADWCVRLMAAEDGIIVEGDRRERDPDTDDVVREWPFSETAAADYQRKPAIYDEAVCPLSADYVASVVEALPLEGSVEVRFGDYKPLYLDCGSVEFAIAPRRKGGDLDG